MTVREIAGIIKGEQTEMKLAWNGCTRDFDPQDRIEIDAFGRYEVEGVIFVAYKEGDGVKQYVEVTIAMAPLVGKEAAV